MTKTCKGCGKQIDPWVDTHYTIGPDALCSLACAHKYRGRNKLA
jgi:hypothetical protein